MSERIPWTRYWAMRGTSIVLERGFLVDPHIWSPTTGKQACAQLQELDSIPCLVLLGEPGLGKTDAIHAYVPPPTLSTAASIVDLKGIGSDTELRRQLLEYMPPAPMQPAHTLTYLLLDGVDESPLGQNVLAGVLHGVLSLAPLSSLRIRLACRTAQWSPALEATLCRLWPDDLTRIYELLPLTIDDAHLAAQRFGCDPGAFLRAVDQRQVGSFASTPITLRFLLTEFREHSDLPSSKTTIFQRGCRVLADELSPSRRGTATASGDLDADQRLAIAARIAAYVQLCGRTGVWLGPDHECPGGPLALRDLAHGIEHVNERDLPVSDTSVQETVGTALFSSRGQLSLGFAHRTYEEFLAAWYLHRLGVPLPQLLQLVLDADAQSQLVIPQLQELAAWLASFAPGLRERILERDPLVLLRSDVSTLGTDDRRRLVDELVAGLAAERWVDHDWSIHGLYKNLAHPGLATQLDPVIRDKSRPFVVRRFAIDVAESCHVADLQALLAGIALDTTESEQMRKEASHALVGIGDTSTRARLTPLLTTTSAEDPDDELRGNALRALWPEVLSTPDVLQHLHAPRNPNLFGSYGFFLHYFPSHAAASELPIVLEWAASQIAARGHSRRFDSLVDDLLAAAAKYADQDEILRHIAAVVWLRVARHEAILAIDRDKIPGLRFVSEEPIRRRLVVQLIGHALLDPNGPIRIAHADGGLVHSGDFSWIVAEIQREPDSSRRTVLAQILLYTYRVDASAPDYIERFDALLDAAGRSSEIQRVFSHLIEPIALDSPRALELRKFFDDERQWQRKHQRPLLSPSPCEHIVAELGKCEAGAPEAWLQAFLWMFVAADGRELAQERLHASVASTPNWSAFDPAVQRRLLAAGRAYVEYHVPDPRPWLEKHVVVWKDAAGYGALVLLQASGELVRRPLDAAVWRRWAPIILAYPSPTSVVGERDVHLTLCRDAYGHAPAEALGAVRSLALREERDHQCLFILDRLPESWDRPLQEAMLDLVRTATLGPRATASILAGLLEQGMPEAMDHAYSLVPLPPPVAEPARTRAQAVAAALIRYRPSPRWSDIVRTLEIDAAFAKAVFAELAHGADYRHRSRGLAGMLTEEQLADLFLCLERLFPHGEDPDHSRDEGAYCVGSRESVADLRDSFLRHLVSFGTPGAVAAIGRIQAACPHLPWLAWQRIKAEDTRRARTWQPLQPAQLAALLADRTRRLVTTNDQLIEIVRDIIVEVQETVSLDGSVARDFWELQSVTNTFRPVNEPRFSQLVARRLRDALQQRLVLVNREVEVSPSPTGRLGERTDILVEIVARTPGLLRPEQLSVVIECKGCWNRGLRVDMKDQLLERYLARTTRTHGIYLVGWYASDRWDPTDHRHNPTQRTEIELQLREHAHRLSIGGYRVEYVCLDVTL